MINYIKASIFVIFCTPYLSDLSAQPSHDKISSEIILIDSLFSDRKYIEVIMESNLILDNPQSSLSDSLLVKISLLRVRAAYYLGRYKDVVTYGEQGLERVDSTDILNLTNFWQYMSTSYIHLKDKPNAIACLENTLELEEQLLILDPEKVVTAYKDLGGLYSYFGDDDLSFENYRKGIELFNFLNLDNFGLRGDLYLNIGANYIASNENDSAFHYLDIAKNDYLRVYNPTNRKLGSVNYNMSVVQDNRGFVFDAINLLKEAELSWNNAYGEHHPRMAYIQINRGQMALKVGDYEKALNSGFKSLDILSHNESSDPSLIRSSHSTIGEAYIELNDYEKALHHHKQAFDITVDTYGEKSEFTYSSASNIADLYQSQSMYDEAKPYINLILKNIERGPNVYYLSVLHLQSKSAFAEQNSKAGFRYLDEVLALIETEGKDFTAEKITVLLDKVRRYIAIDQLENADQLLSELSNILKPTVANYTNLEYSLSNYIAYHNLKGQWHLKKFYNNNDQQELTASHQSFSEAIRIYKNLLLNVGDQNTQFSIAAKADKLMSRATENAYVLHQYNEGGNIEDALSIIESSKNLVLKHRLIKNNMINSGNLPAELRANEIKLNNEIAELKNEIYKLQSDSQEDQWESIVKSRGDLNEKQAEKEKLIEIYKSQYPKYFDLKFDTSTISLDEIVSNLDPNETVINFSMLDSQMYVLILSNQKNEFLKIKLPHDFSEEVNRFHSSISTTDTSNYSNYSNLLRSISNVFDPITSSLDELQTQKLLIIPDGNLAYIPFEILRSADHKSLGEKYEIYYSWSVKNTINQKNKSRNKSKILAVAPTYFDNNENNVSKNNNHFAELVRSGNIPLPGAEAEVNRIKDIFSTSILKGSNASELNFKNQSQDYSILHLSMHGIVDNVNPLLSSLVFTPEADTIENGLLEAWEIYNLVLNADLVVLSSCNTGYGKLEKSEGVMSLSRAFAHAGVPSAIMALWQVPDQSTSEIMVHFYQNLKEGQTKSSALRNAKKTYLENTIVAQQRHPFYWAGLVLTGDDEPLNIDRVGNEWLLGILSFVILLILYFFFGKRRK